MNRLKRMLLWLIRRVHPWSCPECGRGMIRVNFTQLSEDVQHKHRVAGTDGLVKMHCWVCPVHNENNERAYLIF